MKKILVLVVVSFQSPRRGLKPLNLYAREEFDEFEKVSVPPKGIKASQRAGDALAYPALIPFQSPRRGLKPLNYEFA